MQSTSQELNASTPANILKNYKFESKTLAYEKVVDAWLQQFPLDWVNLALVESLHQGRYKVISVEQILTLWQRRGKPSYHFTRDFERLVSNNLPQPLSPTAGTSNPTSHLSSPRSHSRLSPPQTKSIAYSWAPIPEFSTLSATPVDPNSSFEIHQEKGNTVQEETTPSSADSDLSILNLEENSIEPAEEPRIETEIESASHNNPSDIIEIDSLPSDDDSWSNQEDVLSFAPVSQDDSAEEFLIHPIDQFVPQTETSEFCAKLAAMAQVSV